MSELVSAWEELLDELRQQRAGDDPARALEASAFAADWLDEQVDAPLSLPPEHGEPERAFEPYLSLLRLFGRLDRGLSEMLYGNSYAELPPLLGSDFGDWAVGSLVREAYLDLRVAGAAFYDGLDLQAMSLLRQMAELSWRALIVVGEPSVADEWWASIVATAEGGERAKLEKRLWQRHFRPAAMLRQVAGIETRVDGVAEDEAEEHARAIIAHKSALYALLSGTTHGGTELVYASVVRGHAGRLPEDPFAHIGEPTAFGKQLVTTALYLQARFWHYFPRVAFPAEAGATVPPSTPQGALVLTASAVEQLMRRRYPEFVTSA